jgi:CRP-like cAMP-binding protein
MKQGELLLIQEGYVEVAREHEGRWLNIATLGPGDLIGEIEFLLNTAQSTTLRALTECSVLVFPHRLMNLLLNESPTFSASFYGNLARILAQRMRASNFWITEAPPL